MINPVIGIQYRARAIGNLMENKLYGNEIPQVYQHYDSIEREDRAAYFEYFEYCLPSYVCFWILKSTLSLNF
jgi:hypothetical protein